jgi:hypothetical protein
LCCVCCVCCVCCACAVCAVGVLCVLCMCCVCCVCAVCAVCAAFLGARLQGWGAAPAGTPWDALVDAFWVVDFPLFEADPDRPNGAFSVADEPLRGCVGGCQYVGQVWGACPDVL